jgi:hypothetical protein
VKTKSALRGSRATRSMPAVAIMFQFQVTLARSKTSLACLGAASTCAMLSHGATKPRAAEVVEAVNMSTTTDT